jgi:hypothetical protein
VDKKDVIDIKEINKDVVLAQLRNLIDPLFLSSDILKYTEKYISFDEIEKKVNQGAVRRNDISDFIIAFAQVLREDVKASGRTVIETSDIDAAYAKVKDRSPF